MAFEKLVLVTRKTRLDELTARFNTRGQAKFYIEHAGGDFAEYEREHDAYQRSLDLVRRELDFGMPRQTIDRALVLGINPDPERFDGVLLPLDKRNFRRRMLLLDILVPLDEHAAAGPSRPAQLFRLAPRRPTRL
jgi:hypothetical protein